MSARYFALLTNIGVAKVANAAALGIKLNITELAVGDGGGTLPTPTPDQTTLVNERRRAPINQLSIDPLNDAQIIVEQVIPESVGGWWIKEVGLFDEDGDLVAVSNCPETYKPLLQEGSGRTQIVRMVIIVSNTSSVTVKIDPAIVLATREYVDNSVKRHTETLIAQDGLKMIGRCPSIAILRTKLPTFVGQKIDVVSYYEGWAATKVGAVGGGFFNAVNDSTTVDDGGSFIRVSPSWGWQRSFPDSISVYDFGVRADGVADDTARHQAAQDHADKINGRVLLHRYTSLISSTVFQKVETIGQGMDATIIKAKGGTLWENGTLSIERHTGDINTSSYVPMWQLGANPGDTHTPRPYLRLTDVFVSGLAFRPITRSSLRNSILFFADAIHVAENCIAPSFHSVRTEGCQNGYNTYNATGHIAWWDCVSTNNWFGWWVDYTSGDYRMYNCNFVGNQFASVGLHGEPSEARVVGGRPNFSGIFGWSCTGCHLGFSPYGIYQKTGTTGSIGLVDVYFTSTNIEAIGNCGIRMSEHPATSTNNFWMKGSFTWTAPLGTGSATAYQIQGDTNHPIQKTMIKLKHIVSGVSVNLEGTTIPIGNTGLKVEIGTLQTQFAMPSAFRYCSVDSGIERLVDTNFRIYSGISTIPNGTVVTKDSQTLTTLTLPAGLQDAPKMIMEANIPFRTTAAAMGVHFKVRDQAGNDLGMSSLDIPNGNSSVGTLIDFAPNGATSVRLDIETSSTSLSIGAGTGVRVKWSAGFMYGTY